MHVFVEIKYAICALPKLKVYKKSGTLTPFCINRHTSGTCAKIQDCPGHSGTLGKYANGFCHVNMTLTPCLIKNDRSLFVNTPITVIIVNHKYMPGAPPEMPP